MRVQVRRRSQRSVDDRARQVGDDHIVRAQRLVRDATRLDHHEPTRAIDSAGISEGEWREPAARDLDIRLEHRATERAERIDRHAIPARCFAR
jgi:hypothetical protein